MLTGRIEGYVPDKDQLMVVFLKTHA